MAVIFFEGFDLYNGVQANIGLQSRWSPVNWSGVPGIGTGRFGGQCFFWSGEASLTGATMPSANSAFTVAHGYRCSNLSAISPAVGVPRPVVAITSGGFGNYQVGWRPNADGSISVFRLTASNAGTLLGTSAAGVLNSNVWQFVEFSGTINGATGTIILKVDGVTVLNLAGQNTQTQAANTFDGVVLGCFSITNGGATHSIDDLYVLDTAVSIGERRVQTIYGTADTASKDWVADSGTVNFSRVNDATVNTSTYVQSNTVGALDLYDIGDVTGTPTIDSVQITAFAQKTDAGARSFGLVADLSGTQLQSPDIAPGASYFRYHYSMTAKPGGGAWDAASLNGLKIGPKVTA